MGASRIQTVRHVSKRQKQSQRLSNKSWLCNHENIRLSLRMIRRKGKHVMF